MQHKVLYNVKIDSLPLIHPKHHSSRVDMDRTTNQNYGTQSQQILDRKSKTKGFKNKQTKQ